MKQGTKDRRKRKARVCFSVIAGVGGVLLLALFFWAESRLFALGSGADAGGSSENEVGTDRNADTLSAEELERLLRTEKEEALAKLTPQPSGEAVPSGTAQPTLSPPQTEPTFPVQPTDAAEPTQAPEPTATAKPTATPTKAPVSDGSYVKKLADTMILGDSLVEAVSYYHLLDDRHVIAKIGARPDHLRENLSQIAAVYPVNVVLHYGNNCVDPSGSPERVKGFINQYRKVITELQEQQPALHIYVSGIFPVQESAYQHSPELKYIGDYNQALRAMCEELCVTYIDNDEIVKAHPNQVEPDGVHMTRGFYQYYWLQFIADIVS